jgi:predicted GH43/DUF377 family glycosyl hydrolase
LPPAAGDLTEWKKFAGNPVIAAPPAGLEVAGFRDPAVWKEGDTWLMALGSGFRGKGGAVLLYESKDLRHWTYLHPLITGRMKAGAGALRIRWIQRRDVGVPRLLSHRRQASADHLHRAHRKVPARLL